MPPGRGPSLQMRLSTHLSGFAANLRPLESVPRQNRLLVLRLGGGGSRILCNETHGSASVWLRDARTSLGWIRFAASYHNKTLKGERKVYRMYKTSASYFLSFSKASHSLAIWSSSIKSATREIPQTFLGWMRLASYSKKIVECGHGLSHAPHCYITSAFFELPISVSRSIVIDQVCTPRHPNGCGWYHTRRRD
jgi:hypothetical protein